jgi:hypothetical protein
MPKRKIYKYTIATFHLVMADTRQYVKKKYQKLISVKQNNKFQLFTPAAQSQSNPTVGNVLLRCVQKVPEVIVWGTSHVRC